MAYTVERGINLIDVLSNTVVDGVDTEDSSMLHGTVRASNLYPVGSGVIFSTDRAETIFVGKDTVYVVPDESIIATNRKYVSEKWASSF